MWLVLFFAKYVCKTEVAKIRITYYNILFNFVVDSYKLVRVG